MKWAAILLLLLVLMAGWTGLSYFSASRNRDNYRAAVEKLLIGGFETADEQLEEEIGRLGAEIHGIDPRRLEITISRKPPGEHDFLEGLTSGSALPSQSLHLTAEVAYTQDVLLLRPRFSFRATAVRHKREHPHKSLIEEALSGARNQ